MASGINFNPASYQVGGGASVNRQQPIREQSAPGPSDGFQASGAQPAAVTSAAAPSPVHIEVTIEQLTSAAFQQTLATLASSGIPVTISVITASTATPAPQPQQQPPQQSVQSGFGNIAHAPRPPSPPTYGGD